MIDINLKFNIKGIKAFAIFPFVVIEKDYINDPVVKNHEAIHISQQIQFIPLSIIFNSVIIVSLTNNYWFLLLNILPIFNSSLFYVVYVLSYTANRLKYSHKEAYRNIIFEREAFENEKDLNYLIKK